MFSLPLKLPLAIAGALLISSCKSLPIDNSLAADGRDLTLVMGTCSNLPGQGADICRVKESTQIVAEWRIVVPSGPEILGGEIVVFYKDQQKSYGIEPGQSVVAIPWAELVGFHTWERRFEGIALALAKVRYKKPDGVVETIRARGQAILVVLPQGYDPMPIDSGFHAWEGTCRVQYSTAGRSALECKK